MAKDDRKRQPMDAGYAEALGVATYCFSILEWNAVWCGEAIAPGFINTISRKTAGAIAKDLIALAEGRPTDAPARSELIAALQSFEALVKRRNDVIHANPGTAPDGAQQLFRFGQAWTILQLEEIADAFSETSMELNSVFHDHLKATAK